MQIVRSTRLLLVALALCACSPTARVDTAASYTPSGDHGEASIANSPTVILYSVDGRRIPANLEVSAPTGRLGKKSYESLIERETRLDAGPHCLLLQSVYNNEFIQVPFSFESEKAYQLLKYSVPIGLNAFEIYADIFVAPGMNSAFNSRGFISIFDKSKIAGVAFKPTGDGTGDYDVRFRSKADEAALREVFEKSELTGELQTGRYHQVVFSNFAETDFRLARSNVTEEKAHECPPVRLMMANGISQAYLGYLKYPPTLQ